MLAAFAILESPVGTVWVTSQHTGSIFSFDVADPTTPQMEIAVPGLPVGIDALP